MATLQITRESTDRRESTSGSSADRALRLRTLAIAIPSALVFVWFTIGVVSVFSSGSPLALASYVVVLCGPTLVASTLLLRSRLWL